MTLTPLYLTSVMVMYPILFPSWPGALNFRVSGTKLHPAKSTPHEYLVSTAFSINI